MYWEAFERLSTCRSFIGMAGAPGPIPWTAIVEYARVRRFTGEAFCDLETIIELMDAAYRQHVVEELGKSGDAGGVRAPDGEAGD